MWKKKEKGKSEDSSYSKTGQGHSMETRQRQIAVVAGSRWTVRESDNQGTAGNTGAGPSEQGRGARRETRAGGACVPTCVSR